MQEQEEEMQSLALYENDIDASIASWIEENQDRRQLQAESTLKATFSYCLFEVGFMVDPAVVIDKRRSH